MNIVYDADSKKVTAKAGKAFNALFERESPDQPLLILLSGGSSLGLLEYVDADSLSGNITIGMLDDRYSTDPIVNNSLIVQNTAFYQIGSNKSAVFLDSSVGDFETLEIYAERYESAIKEWLALYPDGIIRATIGVGPDGHTSGILPHPEDPEKFNKLFNSYKLVVGYDVGSKNPHRYRMTSTFTLMRKFDRVLTYMTGQNKKAAFLKIIDEVGTLAETPGRILRELKNVELYTDIKI
jgi:6-phosphogluconolactonase/glucosamine-6-phosphate isomerase/deaminase